MNPDADPEKMALAMIDATTSVEELAGEQLRGRLRVLKVRMSAEAAARVSVRLLQRKGELAPTQENAALRAVMESLDKPAFEIDSGNGYKIRRKG